MTLRGGFGGHPPCGSVVSAGGAAGGLCGWHSGIRCPVPEPGGLWGQLEQQPPWQPGECLHSNTPGGGLGVHWGLYGVWVFAASPCRARSPSPQSSVVAQTHWLMGWREHRYWARPALSLQGHKGTASSTAPCASEPKGDGWLSCALWKGCNSHLLQAGKEHFMEAACHGVILLELLWDNGATPGTALPSG